MSYSAEDFKELEKEIQSRADEKYREFQGSLIPDVDFVFYGVRIPVLRKLAKKIMREDWRGFIELAIPSKVHELRLVCGFVIAGAKCSFTEKMEYTRRFVPGINNWAVCDTFCSSLKDVKDNREELFDTLKKYLCSQNEYEVRFGVVMLMFYYLTDEYIDEVFMLYDYVENDGYYAKMAIAWGISQCFVKYRDKTLDYIRTCNLDLFTYNKSIQKIIESLQVTKEDKQMLKTMKR